MEKSKFFKGKKDSKREKSKKTLYAQTSTPKVSKILKIKENFPNLLTKEIENIHKMINDSGKLKSRINITTKGPSRKQVIIPISNDNKSKFMALSSMHIANLNSILKNIKLEIMVNFAWMDQHGIVNTTNKIASSLDLQNIKKVCKKFGIYWLWGCRIYYDLKLELRLHLGKYLRGYKGNDISGKA